MLQQSSWTVLYFLKNVAKHFGNLTHKNIVKHIENLPQHLLKKIIGDNLSITDIASRNLYLSIIGIASGFLKLSLSLYCRKVYHAHH